MTHDRLSGIDPRPVFLRLSGVAIVARAVSHNERLTPAIVWPGVRWGPQVCREGKIIVTASLPADDAPNSRPSVLVIDDDLLFHRLILSELQSDCTVTVASDGLDGYLQAIRCPPDIAVIDIQMPGWDGFRTMEAFRTNAVLAPVKIVIMTADERRSTVLEAIARGADDLMVKHQFSAHSFREKIERLLARAASAS